MNKTNNILKEPRAGYGISKWSDDEDDWSPITPFLGRLR
jgi:hypothetical protein